MGDYYLRCGAVLDEEDAQRVLAIGGGWYVAKSGGWKGCAVQDVRPQRPTYVALHRVVMGAKPGELVEHIDGDALNNRKSNLRLRSGRETVSPGMVFGSLTVVRRVGLVRRECLWECQCACGSLTQRVTGALKRRSKSGEMAASCGCMTKALIADGVRKIVNIGTSFGRWVVVGEEANGRLPCRCSCGVERSVGKGHLVNGETTSCGCAKPRAKPRPRKRPVGGTIEAFDARYVKHDSGCWAWTGKRTVDGYGLMSLGKRGRSATAHRFSWEHHRGPIPDGMCVLHHCDNPPCVNPEHLFIGTRADNVDDMWSKGRGTRQPAQAKISDDDVVALLAELDAGASGVATARKYGISQSYVSMIRRRHKRLRFSPRLELPNSSAVTLLGATDERASLLERLKDG